jgi:hypothetical protein
MKVQDLLDSESYATTLTCKHDVLAAFGEVFKQICEENPIVTCETCQVATDLSKVNYIGIIAGRTSRSNS